MRRVSPKGCAQRGYDILNDVVLNQVLVSFGDAAATRAVIAPCRRTAPAGAAAPIWQGRTAMRISVSSWATTIDDVEASVAAIGRAFDRVRSGGR